jgi:hypothetical protein
MLRRATLGSPDRNAASPRLFVSGILIRALFPWKFRYIGLNFSIADIYASFARYRWQ